MAPEVWENRLSIHSDQYSLAVAYTELRLGRPLFSGKDLWTLGRQHLLDTPNLPGLEAAEKRALTRALAKDPHARYPSCREFVRALRQALLPAPPAGPAPPAPRSGLLTALLGSTLGLCLAGLLFVLL